MRAAITAFAPKVVAWVQDLVLEVRVVYKGLVSQLSTAPQALFEFIVTRVLRQQQRGKPSLCQSQGVLGNCVNLRGTQ